MFEKYCLRITMDRIMDEEVRWRVGIERELASIADQRVCMEMALAR